MNRYSKTERKSNKFKYYMLLSILIHLSVFLFAYSKKNITLGENIIPIEIIDIPSIASQGEYFQKPQEENSKEVKEVINERKEIIEELIKEDKDQNTNQISKIIKVKESRITPSKSDFNKQRGSEGEFNSKEVEAGSLKGKGIEKITCLACLKPKYPKLALKRGYEGILKLKILISKNGEVIDLKIIKSSGYTILDKAGINAAINSKFYPLKKERSLNLVYNLKLNR